MFLFLLNLIKLFWGTYCWGQKASLRESVCLVPEKKGETAQSRIRDGDDASHISKSGNFNGAGSKIMILELLFY